MEGFRRGRKFREKRKTCRDIAVDGRKRGKTDWNEREVRANVRLVAGGYEEPVTKGERESNKFLGIFFFFFFFRKKYPIFRTPTNLIVTLMDEKKKKRIQINK